MLKNVAGQSVLLFAFNRLTNAPVTGDAAQITANISLDGATPGPTDTTNPTEVEDGYYLLPVTKAETNANTVDIYPESSTPNVQVIPANHDRQTVSGTGGSSGSTIDEINAAMAAAVAAQEAGDYATALTKTESAWMRICGLPDSEFENEKLEWSRDGLEKLLAWLRKRVNQTAVDSSGGRGSIIRPVPVTYVRG